MNGSLPGQAKRRGRQPHPEATAARGRGGFSLVEVVVAILILSFWRKPRANWIAIPLDITNEYAILLLGSMITMTPGTVTAKLAPDRRKMLVHVLDTADPEADIRQIKQRYERPLKEIFEC